MFYKNYGKIIMRISVVMQSYLSDYPNSRTNPVEKFHRAIKSFLNQTYDNSELVIISDGCQITTDLFNTHYSSNERIKFAFIHKREKNMYEEVKPGELYFRGVPKRVGVAVSSG